MFFQRIFLPVQMSARRRGKEVVAPLSGVRVPDCANFTRVAKMTKPALQTSSLAEKKVGCGVLTNYSCWLPIAFLPKRIS